MGVEPYLVASSLEAVLAQRLVRVLCKHCKQEDDSPAAQALKSSTGHSAKEDRFTGRSVAANAAIPVTTAVGDFRMDGYRQRNSPDDFEERSSDQIRDAARRDGMRTLAEDGWRLWCVGRDDRGRSSAV